MQQMYYTNAIASLCLSQWLFFFLRWRCSSLQFPRKVCIEPYNESSELILTPTGRGASDVATSYNNLANLYSSHEGTEAFEPLYVKVLKLLNLIATIQYHHYP